MIAPLTLTENLQGTKNKNLGVLLSKNLRETKINGFLVSSTSLEKQCWELWLLLFGSLRHRRCSRCWLTRKKTSLFLKFLCVVVIVVSCLIV